MCSYPWCNQRTSGSTSDGKDVIRVGVAAHICAAAPGGPRYDPGMSSVERSSAGNGIWLCETHARAADSGDPQFTVDAMRSWKKQAQRKSFHGVMGHPVPVGGTAENPSEEERSARLRAAAAADLETFRRAERWSSTAISRTLDIDKLGEATDTAALARGLASLGEVVIVAPPGMGKTTTLFQLSDEILKGDHGSPIVVPLGNWSADDASLLESILKRPAFHTISKEDFRSVAARPGVFLLLDGWNELDSASRGRAAAEIEHLQLQLPSLSVVIATREQGGGVPIDGVAVQLRSMSEHQQLEMARARHGELGERLVRRAWRTRGVRELVRVPLYLNALLSLPEDIPFPTTKEEVLRRFIAVHEKDYQRSEALAEATDGLHDRFLQGLAETATRFANTTIARAIGRKSVSDTAATLKGEGQVTEKPKPSGVLEALVNHHVLIRHNGPEGYAFQHQQFQEWYASRFVQDLMEKSVTDDDARENLKADVLDLRIWEEPILFACERLARGDEAQQETCAKSILASLEVDPMLAAEMIWRSSDGVWQRVGPCVEDFVRRWHTPGQVDRAARFMVISGRAEFRAYVWPLIAHKDQQIQLHALRAGPRFHPSVLGKDAAVRIGRLSRELRRTILGEIAMYSGMDGLAFAAETASVDPAPEVRATVAESLAFRRADRHVATVLQDADDRTFDLLAHRDLFDRIADEGVSRRVSTAREHERAKGIPARKRLSALVYEQGDDDDSTEVAAIVAEVEIEDGDNHAESLIYLASERFPRAVAEGMLKRVRNGRKLPYRAPDYMAAGEFALEDEALVNVVLDSDRLGDVRAEAAASVLGSQAVGRVIDRRMELEEQIRSAGKGDDNDKRDHCRAIEDRICSAQASHVLGAIEQRSGEANNRTIESFADLICRYGSRADSSRPGFDATAQAKIAAFVKDWGDRLLASSDATRRQLASIATLARYSPSRELLSILERLLDEELRLLRGFQQQAGADADQQGIAMQEARYRWNMHYEHAFADIGCPEASALMQKFLLDKEFGPSAARVLAAHWRARNEPRDESGWPRRSVFVRVAERRAAREAAPEATSDEADAIFSAIGQLTGTDSTEADQKSAIDLAIVACALPHGERDEVIAGLIAKSEPERRLALLTNLVLAGEIIDVKRVMEGIAHILEQADTRTGHRLVVEHRTLQPWLRLLPFTTDPSKTVEFVQRLPEQHRTPLALEELLDALGYAPGAEVEEAIFGLAEADPNLYLNRAWLDAAVRRGTRSSAKRLVDLAREGAFSGKGRMSDRDIYTRLAPLIDEYPELRAYLYQRLEDAIGEHGMRILAQTVAENPDEEGLMKLIELDIEHKHGLTTWLALERVLTRREPSEHAEGVYEVLPVAASGVRRNLLARTRDGGPEDLAARYLNEIDEFRDQFGTPESEPRHPDLASRKAWPIVTVRKDAPTKASTPKRPGSTPI